MADDRKLQMPRPQGLALWVPVTVLLSLGLLTTIVDFTALAGKELARASAQGQHFTVDPLSGKVTLSDANTEGESTHDAVLDASAKNKDTEHAPDIVQAPDEAKPAEPAPENAADAAAATAIPTSASQDDTPAKEQHTAPTTTEGELSAHEAAAKKPAETEAKPVEAKQTETKPAEPAHAAPSDTALPPNASVLRTTPIMENLTAPIQTKDSLVPAPAPEVTEEIDGMKLPKRGEKGVIPSRLYAHPFKRTAEQTLISFVVLNAGLDPQVVGTLMALPPEISVAYSPYTRPKASYSENLRSTGHELWTMLPTMTDRYPSDDPGPLSILARMPEEEIVRRVRAVLAVIPGSIGVVLPINENISSQPNTLTPALTELDARGLLVLSTHPNRTVAQVAGDKQLSSIIRRADLLLDPEPNETQIRSRLAGLVAAAQDKSQLVVLLSARPQTLRILAEWLHKNPLPSSLVMAPLSAVYQPAAAPEAKEEPKAEADGHGGGEKKEKPKPKPKEKAPKVLPQDKYKQPPAGEKKGEH